MHPEQKEILRVFAAEASECLDELDELLGEIEADPESRQTVDQFMRAAHTLKGSAGVAGVADVADLTHVVESAMENLREGKLRPTPELFDRLAKAFDAITRVLPDIGSGQLSAGSMREVGADLRSWLDEADDTGERATKQTADQDGFTLGEYDHVRIRVLQEQEKNLFVVGIDVPIDVSGDASELAAWGSSTLKTLRGIGVCVTTNPPSSSFAELATRKMLSALLASDKAEAEIVESLTQSLGSRPSTRPYRAVATPDAGASARQVSATVVADRTVRVDLGTLDDLLRLAGELMINRDKFLQVAKQFGEDLGDMPLASEIGDTAEQLGHLTGELQDAIMQARMVPVARIYRGIKRSVRRVSRGRKVSVKLKTEGADTELDKNLVDSLAAPFAQFVAGLVEESDSGHSVELRAVRRWNHVMLTIASPVAASQAQSTALRTAVVETGGTVEFQESNTGGYVYTVALPLTLAIIRVMMTSVGDAVYAFPIESVKETFKIHSHDIVRVKGTRATELRGAALSLVFLDEFFDTKETDHQDTGRVLVLSEGNRAIGVVVDELVGIREVVIKPLSQRFLGIREFSGSAILGDVQIALILNTEVLVQQAISNPTAAEMVAGKPHQRQRQGSTA